MMRSSFVKRFRGVVTLITGLSLAILITACSDKTRVPSDVLDREDMEAVMWDMIQADRYATMFFPSDSTKRKDIKTETLKLYDQVFKIHDITQEEFVKSYKFYLTRPDISKVMFDSIYVRANRIREEENMARQREQQKKDSIAGLKLKDSLAAGLKRDSVLNQLKKDTVLNRGKIDSILNLRKKDSLLNQRKTDSILSQRKKDSIMNKMKNNPRLLNNDSTEFRRRRDSVLKKLQQRASERRKRPV